MAVGGAVPGDEAQQLALIQLHRLAGGEVVSHQDGGLVVLHGGVPRAGEDVYHPARDVLHVGGPGPHILVVHSGEGGGEILAGGLGGVLGGGPLGVDDALDGLQIVVVVQHHLMDLKDGGVVLAHLVQSLVVEAAQLLLGLLLGGLEALPLLLGGEAGGLAGLDLRLLIDAQRTNGNAV